MTGSGESGRRRFRENLSNDAVPGGGYVPIDVSTAGAGPRNDFHHPDHGVWKGEYRLSGASDLIAAHRAKTQGGVRRSRRALMVMPLAQSKTFAPIKTKGFDGMTRVDSSAFFGGDEALAGSALDKDELRKAADAFEAARQDKYGDGYSIAAATANRQNLPSSSSSTSTSYEFGGQVHVVEALEEHSDDDDDENNFDAGEKGSSGLEGEEDLEGTEEEVMAVGSGKRSLSIRSRGTKVVGVAFEKRQPRGLRGEILSSPEAAEGGRESGKAGAVKSLVSSSSSSSSSRSSHKKATSSSAAVPLLPKVQVWVTLALRVHVDHDQVALPRWYTIAFSVSAASAQRKGRALELESSFQADIKARIVRSQVSYYPTTAAVLRRDRVCTHSLLTP